MAEEGIGMIRRKRQRPAITREGLLKSRQCQERVSAVDMSAGFVGLESDNAFVADQSLVKSSKVEQNAGTIVQRAGVIAADGQGSVVTDDGLLELFELSEHIAEIVKYRSVRWVGCYGAGEEVCRRLMAPALRLQEAEEAQGVGVIGRAGEDFAVSLSASSSRPS